MTRIVSERPEYGTYPLFRTQRWPGQKGARKKVGRDKPTLLEQAIRNDIELEVGSELIARFIPYVQMHEFEALLFSETSALAEVMRKPKTKHQLDEIRNDFATPEDINDSAATAPSKRIEEIYQYYRKNTHGVIAAERITIDVMIGCSDSSNSATSRLWRSI